MKAKVVEKVKFAPGKWKEAGALMKTFKEVAEKQGFPPVKIYGFISGGDVVQTLNFVTDWDSLGAMETVMDKMFSDPEMLEMMEKWSGVVESHKVSILKELSPEYNNGKRVNIINQKLGYLVRGGEPDAIDSIVPMAYGSLALDLIIEKNYGRLVCLRKGQYDNVPIDIVTSYKKTVNVSKYYNTNRLRPHYHGFGQNSLFIMTGDEERS